MRFLVKEELIDADISPTENMMFFRIDEDGVYKQYISDVAAGRGFSSLIGKNGRFALLISVRPLKLTFMLDEDTEYYTISKVKRYVNIYFPDTDDITRTTELVDLTLNSIIEFPETPFIKGKFFAGWYTKPNGEGKRVFDDLRFYEIGTDTLYAHWKLYGSDFNDWDFYDKYTVEYYEKTAEPSLCIMQDLFMFQG